MKNLILAVTFLFISVATFSQNSDSGGRNQLNLGVGFSGWGVPFYIGFDHFVSEDVSLGAEFSYRSYRENWEHKDYNRSIMGFSGNANYHFNRILDIPKNWDFYAGLNIGFYAWADGPTGYTGTNKSGLGLGGQIGERYFLSDKIGLNLEFGGGNAFSGGKFGLTIKL